MKVSGFFTRTDIVVIGTNPEMADYDNPRGHIHGFAAYVVADSEHGDRRELHVVTNRFEREALEPADKLAAALNARLAAGKLPVGFDRWHAGRPGYGSDAYIEYGQADDVALERREAEEEAFC